MLKELHDNLSTLTSLLEVELKRREDFLKEAEQHLGHFAEAAFNWEKEKEASEQEHKDRLAKAEKDKELLNSLLKK